MSTHPPQGLTVVNLDEERHETSPAPKSSRKVYTNWTHPQFRPTALRVALVVGSVLLCINHGAVLI